MYRLSIVKVKLFECVLVWTMEKPHFEEVGQSFPGGYAQRIRRLKALAKLRKITKMRKTLRISGLINIVRVIYKMASWAAASIFA